jgi:hypothetical protein
MVHSPSRWLTPAALLVAALSLLVFALAAQAQPAARASKPDPLDAKASVPAPAYASSLSAYRRLSDEKLTSWREANDTVARIGGWRVYAREAQQPDPAAKPPRAPEPAQTTQPLPLGQPGRITP